MEKIKQIREKTGAGIVDCKKALDESGGDIEKAIEILRKKGITKAAKRCDRETSEGIIFVDADEKNQEGYILKINSETDFVARNEKFKEFSQKVFELIKEKKPKNIEELISLNMENGTVKESIDILSGTIGEKLEIDDFTILAGKTVSVYSHMGGRIGVLVSLSEENKKELGTDLAMQIAATNPKYIGTDEVSEAEIEKEKEIYKVQLLKEGKPEEILNKILDGKISKYFEEICLLKQEYIKDDKKRVEDILGEVKIEKFIRYSL